MRPSTPLKQFHQTLSPQVTITDTHRYYVPLLGDDPVKDPILQLASQIDFAGSESVHLLTGFRGNGKSTQLRRLKHLLEGRGHTVFLVNLLDWMMMSQPVALTDFLLSVVGAFDEQCDEAGVGGPSFWQRALDWMSSLRRVSVTGPAGGGAIGVADGFELGASALGLEFKAALQGDSSFKAKLQKHLEGQVSRLVKEIREHVAARIDAIRTKDPDARVVLLVDSVEQLRGAGGDADRVQDSARELFTAEAPNLAIPRLHVVYTFPPSLLPLAQNLGRPYGSAVTLWPNVHVRQRDGSPDQAGLGIFRCVIHKRYDGIDRLAPVLSDDQLSRLAQASGGDLRDYFRLVRDCVVLTDIAASEVATDAIVDQCIAKLRRELLPLADDDAEWLRQIHQRKDLALRSDRVSTLMRFFDSNLIMNYENGSTWYDVHPLVVDEIVRLGEVAPP
jgi:hypothetical protein